MLNHVELQGKIAGGTLISENAVSFFLDHTRGFGPETDKFTCVLEGERRRQLDGAKEGRTVIVTGRLRAGGVGKCEIVCRTVDFVDGGGGNGG